MREILTAGRYFREKYGVNVYKIPISLLKLTNTEVEQNKRNFVISKRK